MKATNRVEGPANFLTMADPTDEHTLPTPQGDADTVDLLVVSLTGPPDSQIRLLRETVSGETDTTVAITPEDPTDTDEATVRVVENPGDLTTLSVEVTKAMGEVESDTTYLYFSSITALLQYTELKSAYRFFNSLTGRAHVEGCTGYFEMNPYAHDDRTVKTIQTLFDGSVGDDV